MHSFRERELSRPKIRQPILMLAASNDTVVSTPAIEEFAYHLRAGSHLVIAGSKHEILQEQDRYRAAVLGGVRRLRAGHAAVQVMQVVPCEREDVPEDLVAAGLERRGCRSAGPRAVDGGRRSLPAFVATLQVSRSRRPSRSRVPWWTFAGEAV